MAREYSRAARLADQIQRDLAELIRSEVKDPRVGLVTVTAVEVSPDLSYARVFVTTLADTIEQGRRDPGPAARSRVPAQPALATP